MGKEAFPTKVLVPPGYCIAAATAESCGLDTAAGPEGHDWGAASIAFVVTAGV